MSEAVRDKYFVFGKPRLKKKNCKDYIHISLLLTGLLSKTERTLW